MPNVLICLAAFLAVWMVAGTTSAVQVNILGVWRCGLAIRNPDGGTSAYQFTVSLFRNGQFRAAGVAAHNAGGGRGAGTHRFVAQGAWRLARSRYGLTLGLQGREVAHSSGITGTPFTFVTVVRNPSLMVHNVTLPGGVAHYTSCRRQ